MMIVIQEAIFAIGCSVCILGSLVACMWLCWQMIEIVCKYTGWTKQLIEAAARIVRERQHSRTAK